MRMDGLQSTRLAVRSYYQAAGQCITFITIWQRYLQLNTLMQNCDIIHAQSVHPTYLSNSKTRLMT